MIVVFLCFGTIFAKAKISVRIPPIAKNDSILIGKNQTILIDVLSNDTDPDGDINLSTIQITSTAQLGLVNIIGNKIEYTPGTNVCGFDSVKYRITDQNSEVSNIATIYIEITCFNIAPIAKNDQLILNEDILDSIDVFDNDRYTDGPDVEYSILQNGKHGVANVSKEGMLNYISNLNFSGLDTVSYTFCDLDPTNSLCDTAQVFITVTPINDPPSAHNDTLTVYVNQTKNINLSANDSTIDGPSLNYSIITNSINGSTILVSNGNCGYHAGSVPGKDSLFYEVCDLFSPSLCDSAWVIINILPVYDKPIANDDTLKVQINASNSVNILENDWFPNTFNDDSVFFINKPNTGLFSYNASTITYTPTINFTGKIEVQYFVKDNLDSISNIATITILINKIPSSANICSLRTIVNQAFLINPFLKAVKGTADIDYNNILITQVPSNGILENYNAISRSVKYIPDENYFGNDSIKFKIIDEDGFTSEDIKVCLEIINDISISTSGTITPNGDGINDYLTFDNIDDYPNNEVIIFDRYWNEVYHIKGYSSTNYWTAENINIGTYFFVVTITISEIKKTIKGYISVLK